MPPARTYRAGAVSAGHAEPLGDRPPQASLPRPARGASARRRLSCRPVRAHPAWPAAATPPRPPQARPPPRGPPARLPRARARYRPPGPHTRRSPRRSATGPRPGRLRPLGGLGHALLSAPVRRDARGVRAGRAEYPAPRRRAVGGIRPLGRARRHDRFSALAPRAYPLTLGPRRDVPTAIPARSPVTGRRRVSRARLPTQPRRAARRSPAPAGYTCGAPGATSPFAAARPQRRRCPRSHACPA